MLLRAAVQDLPLLHMNCLLANTAFLRAARMVLIALEKALEASVGITSELVSATGIAPSACRHRDGSDGLTTGLQEAWTAEKAQLELKAAELAEQLEEARQQAEQQHRAPALTVPEQLPLLDTEPEPQPEQLEWHTPMQEPQADDDMGNAALGADSPTQEIHQLIPQRDELADQLTAAQVHGSIADAADLAAQNERLRSELETAHQQATDVAAAWAAERAERDEDDIAPGDEPPASMSTSNQLALQDVEELRQKHIQELQEQQARAAKQMQHMTRQHEEAMSALCSRHSEALERQRADVEAELGDHSNYLDLKYAVKRQAKEHDAMHKRVAKTESEIEHLEELVSYQERSLKDAQEQKSRAEAQLAALQERTESAEQVLAADDQDVVAAATDALCEQRKTAEREVPDSAAQDALQAQKDEIFDSLIHILEDIRGKKQLLLDEPHHRMHSIVHGVLDAALSAVREACVDRRELGKQTLNESVEAAVVKAQADMAAVLEDKTAQEVQQALRAECTRQQAAQKDAIAAAVSEAWQAARVQEAEQLQAGALAAAAADKKQLAGLALELEAAQRELENARAAQAKAELQLAQAEADGTEAEIEKRAARAAEVAMVQEQLASAHQSVAAEQEKQAELAAELAAAQADVARARKELEAKLSLAVTQAAEAEAEKQAGLASAHAELVHGRDSLTEEDAKVAKAVAAALASEERRQSDLASELAAAQAELACLRAAEPVTETPTPLPLIKTGEAISFSGYAETALRVQGKWSGTSSGCLSKAIRPLRLHEMAAVIPPLPSLRSHAQMPSEGAVCHAGGAPGPLSTPASVSAPASLMRSALKTGGSVTKKVSWDPSVAHWAAQVRSLSHPDGEAETRTPCAAIKGAWMITSCPMSSVLQ